MGLERGIELSSELTAILREELSKYPEDSVISSGNGKLAIYFKEESKHKVRIMPEARTIVVNTMEEALNLLMYETIVIL